MTLILGGGLAGISASYHLGHHRCRVLEAKTRPFGHIQSLVQDGFTWDEGPHVSFTKHEVVKRLFADSVGGEFEEYEARTRNYYQGHWIEHPAQSNLYQVPEPLRSRCLESFRASRSNAVEAPANYQEWLDQAFGPEFAARFPAAYTRKYWTTGPERLTTDWVGGRVFLPQVEEVEAGAVGPLGRPTHYITQVRYPRKGGYESFARKMAEGMQVETGARVVRVDLAGREVVTADGRRHAFTRLINTLPLPEFVACCAQATPAVKEAVEALSCTQLLLVNVTAPHPTQVEGHWFYVYDEDKWSTRINCTERLALGNAPKGHTGVQVEVYFSKYRPQTVADEGIAAQVVEELVEMGFIRPDLLPEGRGSVRCFTHRVPWANILFDSPRRQALDTIWTWLEAWGLEREMQDLEPMTDWSRRDAAPSGPVVMAGRFAQWKYYWTDDCVLRGQHLFRPS